MSKEKKCYNKDCPDNSSDYEWGCRYLREYISKCKDYQSEQEKEDKIDEYFDSAEFEQQRQTISEKETGIITEDIMEKLLKVLKEQEWGFLYEMRKIWKQAGLVIQDKTSYLEKARGVTRHIESRFNLNKADRDDNRLHIPLPLFYDLRDYYEQHIKQQKNS